MREESRKLIGTKMRILRKKHGWRITEVAEKLGLSAPALSKIETGVTDINISRMEQIAKLYDINIETLFIDKKKAPDVMDEETIRLNIMIAEKEQELLHLQRTAIDLLEEICLRHKDTSDENMRDYYNSHIDEKLET